MKRRISIILLLIATLTFSLLAFTACGNDNDENGAKQVPVYQGMTITKSNSVLSLASYRMSGITLLSANNENNGDNGNHYGHYKGDHTDRNDTIDEDNPYPDNNANENIEEEIKSSLNVIGSPDEIYYATPNEDIYINIHIDNPDSFEIMSFTLNGKKYSSYMFEEGSDMETIVLKYNVGDATGIVEYTIDAIKYIDGTEIKDVIIDGNKTVMAGIRTENQVVASVTDVDIDTNVISFNVNVKDNNSLVEFSKGALKAVIYDGFNIISEKDIAVGNNNVIFDGLKTNTVYQYAVVGYYDDLSGDGFGMNVLYKDAFYTDSVVLFDNITVGQENVSFSFLWHENHLGKAISALKLYKGETFVKDLVANATAVDGLLSNTTYKLVAEYPNGDKTESIYLEFTTLAKATPEISVVNPTKTQTNIGFEISETDTDNVGSVTKIELVHASGTVTSTSLEQRVFLNLLSNNTYTVKVTYVYDLNDGTGAQTVAKELAITTDAKKAPAFTVKNENITTESINAEYDVSDVDNILSDCKVELYRGDSLISENTDKKINFTGLDYYVDYTVRFTYQYDLNDGNGKQTATYDYSFKTIPYIDVIECSIANTSAVSEGETIFVSVKLDNPLGMTVESVVINGVMYSVTTSSTQNKIFVEIVYNGQFVGGDTYLKIDNINANIGTTTVCLEPESEISDNVFINGRLEVLSIEYVNENFETLDSNSWMFPTEKVYILITLNNSTGYIVDSLTDYIKLDNNRYYKQISCVGWLPQQSISYISYHNEYISKTLEFSNVHSTQDIFVVRSNEVKYISTPDDLKKMSDGYYYELTNSIDLAGIEWYGNSFVGVFDGKGYSIKNMSFVSTLAQNAYLGLFTFGSGIINNVNIEEATIIADIVSENSFYIARCGGLVAEGSGKISFSNCHIDEYSVFEVNNKTYVTTGSSVAIGGLIGGGWGKFTNCTNRGSVSASAMTVCFGFHAGGLSGNSSGTFIDCINYGNVSANVINVDRDYSVGGIVGSSATIINCANFGDVSSNWCAGGIVGSGNIVNCVNSGSVSANYYAGGVAAYAYYNSIINSYSLVKGNDYNGEPCTIDQLNSKEFYTETLGWSEDVWDFSELDVENGKYPKLKQ